MRGTVVPSWSERSAESERFCAFLKPRQLMGPRAGPQASENAGWASAEALRPRAGESRGAAALAEFHRQRCAALVREVLEGTDVATWEAFRLQVRPRQPAPAAANRRQLPATNGHSCVFCVFCVCSCVRLCRCALLCATPA